MTSRFISFLGLFSLLIASACHSSHSGHHENGTFMTTSPIVKDTLVYKEYVSQIQSIQHIELRALEKGYLQNSYVD